MLENLSGKQLQSLHMLRRLHTRLVMYNFTFV